MRVQDNVCTHCNNKEGVRGECALMSIEWSATILSSEQEECSEVKWMLFTTIPPLFYMLLVALASNTSNIQRYCKSQLLGFCVSVIPYANVVYV